MGNNPIGYISESDLKKIQSRGYSGVTLRTEPGSNDFRKAWGKDIPLYTHRKNTDIEREVLSNAAPELYEALMDVLDEISNLPGDEIYNFGTTYPFDKARAALAKARGEV